MNQTKTQNNFNKSQHIFCWIKNFHYNSHKKLIYLVFLCGSIYLK